VEGEADAVRPRYALYFGGMGARGRNFHADVAIRMGYEAEVEKIQDLYLSGRKQEAAAAVPTKLIEQLTLIGPKDKIRHDLDAWRDSIVTTLLVAGDPQTPRTARELALGERGVRTIACRTSGGGTRRDRSRSPMRCESRLGLEDVVGLQPETQTLAAVGLIR